MNDDDNIETLDKLFNAINEAMQEKVEMGITVTSDLYNHYIIHKNDGMCVDITEILNTLDEKLEEFETRQLEKLQWSKCNSKPDCKLIVIDPISAYLDGSDSHNNADVRNLLAPLAELAASQRVAIVAITHLNKGSNQNAMYRATGSLAFVAAARAVFVVVRDNDDQDRRLILPIKNNLGSDSTGFAYRVQQASNLAPVIEWEPETISISADDALISLPDDIWTEREEAREWLINLLETNGGSVLAEEIEKERRIEGISQATLRRARNDLSKDRLIDKNKSLGTGKFRWYLCAPDNQDASVSKHEQHEQHDKTVDIVIHKTIDNLLNLLKKNR